MLHRVPNDLVAQLGLRVMFPAVSQNLDMPRGELRASVLRHRWPILGALAILVALMATFGDLVVLTLYDDRYRSAAWMFQILALGLWPRMLTNTMAPTLLGIGEPRYLAYCSLLRLVFLAVALPMAHGLYGMPGVVVAVALSGIADYVIESYGLWRHDLSVFGQDLRLTCFWVVLLAALAGAKLALGLEVVL